MKGKILIKIRGLAQERGGQISASVLEEQGWPRKRARTYLRNMTTKGHFIRRAAGSLPLKRGPWEPTYQLTLPL